MDSRPTLWARRLWLGIALAVTLAVAGCSGPPGGSGGQGGGGSASHDVTGSIVVPGNFKNGYVTANRQTNCLVVNDSYDIQVGKQVELQDETGATIALADLAFGSPATIGNDVPFQCKFVFTFSDVPAAKFYKLKMGLHDAPAMSAADLEAAGWAYTQLVLK